MKFRLLACAVAGLSCTVPAGAGAQVSGGNPGRVYGAFVSGPPAYAGGSRHAVPLEQITANVRAAGLQLLSKPTARRGLVRLSRRGIKGHRRTQRPGPIGDGRRP
jgi:hypothetical protein